jgi:hypothetical protein
MRAQSSFVAACCAALLGCAGGSAPIPVAVVLRGDAALAHQVRAELGKPNDDFAVRFSDLPAAVEPPKSVGDVEAALATARKQYLVPDVPRCLAALPSDAVVADLLASAKRALVARVLFWQIACQVAANDLPEAKRRADAFAALDLEVPSDVQSASPEVETVLARAMQEASAAPPATLRVSSAGAALAVSMDGRPKVCVTPCTIPVRRGTHTLRAEADGIVTENRSLHVEESSAEVRFAAAPAPPEMAAEQWALRYGSAPHPDSAQSVRLLESGTRAKNLVLISAERGAGGSRLSGVLAVSGTIRSRAERSRTSADVGAEAWPLLNELALEGSVIENRPITSKPLFWICIGVAAAAAATTTYFLAQPTPSRTEVRF